jgi:hypothetical protein
MGVLAQCRMQGGGWRVEEFVDAVEQAVGECSKGEDEGRTIRATEQLSAAHCYHQQEELQVSIFPNTHQQERTDDKPRRQRQNGKMATGKSTSIKSYFWYLNKSLNLAHTPPCWYTIHPCYRPILSK